MEPTKPPPPDISETIRQLQKMAKEKGLTPKPCPFCGGPISPRPNAKYCSDRCRNRARNERMKLHLELMAKGQEAFEKKLQDLADRLEKLEGKD